MDNSISKVPHSNLQHPGSGGLENIPEDSISQILPVSWPHSPTLRDFLSVLFRHRKLILITVTVFIAGTFLAFQLVPKRYESRMKILVKRERPDMVVSSTASNTSSIVPSVTLEDINSEVELLRSADLLEKTVIACNLYDQSDKESIFNRLGFATGGQKETPEDEDNRISIAVHNLDENLDIKPIDKSHMIEVRYSSTDPQEAAYVLKTLASLYLDKHLSVHRPPGALDFFQTQTGQYQKELESAEQKLADFGEKEGVLSINVEKDIALHALNNLKVQLQEAKTEDAVLDKKIQSLREQIDITPSRVTTQVKKAANQSLLQQLQTTLLDLEMKRTELLSKFEPGYRTVQEIDAQIAQARAALADAQKGSLIDETTDLDNTRLWLDEELARTLAERETVKARIESLSENVERESESTRQMSQKEVQYQDLNRRVKTAEENYLLYQRKQEEARISDELDRKRIVNAVIAEAATVPSFPSGPNRLVLSGLSLLLGLMTGFGLAFLADYTDPTFRTPEEVESLLNVPVVACIPKS